MTVRLEDIPTLYNAFRGRWTERDERVLITDRVVADGDFSAKDANDEDLTNRSPNLVQVGIEDTAEAAGAIPTPRVTPSGPTDTDKRRASAMERMAANYLDRSQFELLNIKSLMELVGFGYHVWTVVHDKKSGGPVIEWRDPRTCYPEPGHRPGDSIRRCFFAREVYLHQLPAEWVQKVADRFAIVGPIERSQNVVDHKVTLLEYFSEDEIKVCALYQSGGTSATPGRQSWEPVLLEEDKPARGIGPVVIGQRITLDGEPRGQFDQVINVLQSHVRLMSLILDYADQAVYSDVWVKDLIGQMPYGGGSFISLGAQGSIGRVPPAVTSFAVDNQLQQLVDNVHLGGRWPKSRPGEIDQAIASAKFIEATAGMMNTVIRTLHLIMKRSLEQALRLCFVVDHEYGKDRTVAGILNNQQFLVERKKSDIDLKAQVHADYGIGLGRDPAQTLVLGLQGMGAGLFSVEFVQENFDGITDVAKERQRIDVEQFRSMALAMLLQGLQAKEIPESALIEIAKARANGDDVFELYEKYVVKPKEEMLAQQIPSGLGGPPMMPGAPPEAGGLAGASPPPPPEAAGLLAALGAGGGPPPGPEAPQPMSRLSVPLPGRGSFVGSQQG
jgi:hypothetical protein